MKILLFGQGLMGQAVRKACTIDDEIYDALCIQDMSKIEVAIDFSSRENIKNVLSTVKQIGCPLVCGTTGLNDEEMALLKEMSHFYPIVYSPNYSIGMHAMTKALSQIRTYMNDYTCKIIEAHRKEKKDVPSGTAKRLQRLLDCKDVYSIRKDNIVGYHTVSFSNDAETVQVTHRVNSRCAFADGALLAANWVLGKQPSLYSFGDVLDE